MIDSHFFFSGDLDLDCLWHFLFWLLLDFSGDLLLNFFSHAFFHGSFCLFFANRRMTCTLAMVFVFLNLQNVVYCHFHVFFLVMEMVKILMNILPKHVKMILMKTVKMILMKIHDYTFFCYGFSSLQKQTYCDSCFF